VVDEGYPSLMLFTGNSLPEPARRRRGPGIELMTCAPNALQPGEGQPILAPGKSFAGLGIAPE
jgi:aldose 1-epimerase